MPVTDSIREASRPTGLGRVVIVVEDRSTVAANFELAVGALLCCPTSFKSQDNRRNIVIANA
jgi:hypothetical protein